MENIYQNSLLDIPQKMEETILLREKPLLLIVEDNADNFRLYECLLRKEFDLLHAWNGEESINMYRLHLPDLILMDIKMPVMDGYEAFTEIRKLSYGVPIIAVTAYAYASDEQKAIEHGFTDYLSKPIQSAELRSKIKSYLNIKSKN